MKEKMNIPFSPPDMTTEEAKGAYDAVLSGWITTGPRTKQFENELSQYCDVKKTACLNSATACMELSLRVLGVGPGDEVITSAYTYTASASVIEHVGAKVVLVDSEKNSPFISLDEVEKAINERTKAIIPIDIGGRPVDYDRLFSIIESKRAMFTPNSDLQRALGRIAVVGDCAHSFGAKYKGKNVACYPDFACFSFHAVKNLTTAEGGAVCFKDIGDVTANEIYKRFMLLSLHGQSKDALAKTQLGAWEYDIIVPGYKCNMTDIFAAIGIEQLHRYDEMVEIRKRISDSYDAAICASGLADIVPEKGENFVGSYHLYFTRVHDCGEKRRNDIIVRMAENGVATNVHYKPLPMMTAYKKMGYDIKDFPNAFDFYQNEVTLPLYSTLDAEKAEYVVKTYLDAIENTKDEA